MMRESEKAMIMNMDIPIRVAMAGLVVALVDCRCDERIENTMTENLVGVNENVNNSSAAKKSKGKSAAKRDDLNRCMEMRNIIPNRGTTCVHWSYLGVSQMKRRALWNGLEWIRIYPSEYYGCESDRLQDFTLIDVSKVSVLELKKDGEVIKGNDTHLLAYLTKRSVDKITSIATDMKTLRAVSLIYRDGEELNDSTSSSLNSLRRSVKIHVTMNMTCKRHLRQLKELVRVKERIVSLKLISSGNVKCEEFTPQLRLGQYLKAFTNLESLLLYDMGDNTWPPLRDLISRLPSSVHTIVINGWKQMKEKVNIADIVVNENVKTLSVRNACMEYERRRDDRHKNDIAVQRFVAATACPLDDDAGAAIAAMATSGSLKYVHISASEISIKRAHIDEINEANISYLHFDNYVPSSARENNLQIELTANTRLLLDEKYVDKRTIALLRRRPAGSIRRLEVRLDTGTKLKGIMEAIERQKGSIVELSIINNRSTTRISVDDEVLASIAEMRNLVSLVLYNTRIEGRGWRVVLRELRGLKNLGVDAEDVKQLYASKINSQLLEEIDVLNISGVFDDKVVSALRGHAITTLLADDVSLSCKGLESLNLNSSLSEIYVSGTLDLTRCRVARFGLSSLKSVYIDTVKLHRKGQLVFDSSNNLELLQIGKGMNWKSTTRLINHNNIRALRVDHIAGNCSHVFRDERGKGKLTLVQVSKIKKRKCVNAIRQALRSKPALRKACLKTTPEIYKQIPEVVGGRGRVVLEIDAN